MVVTWTSTVPAEPAGATAVSDVADVNVTLVAVVPPNLTVELDVNPVPVMATEVPPASGPLVGLIAVTVVRAS